MKKCNGDCRAFELGGLSGLLQRILGKTNRQKIKEFHHIDEDLLEELAYQHIYDTSNDWGIETPTWDMVKDAYKAGYIKSREK